MPNQSDPNSNKPVADQSPSHPPVPIASIQPDLPPLPPDFQNIEPDNPADTTISQPPDLLTGNLTPAAQSASMPAGTAAPSELPPVIFAKPKKKYSGGRIVATILGIFLLVGGIGAGIALTQQPQIFQGKAWVPQWGGDPEDDPENPSNLDEEEEEEDWIPGQDQFSTYTGDTQTDPLNCGSIGHACDSGDSCTGGICISPINTDCGRQNDPGAPGCCSFSEAECDSSQGDVVCEPGPNGPRKECRASSSGQHCTLSTGASGCGELNSEELSEPVPSPTATPNTTAQCLNVKAYSSVWAPLNTAELVQLKPGATVNFCVTGSASSGTFDKAQFLVNGVLQAVTTTKRPGAEDFCQSVDITPLTTNVDIKARIHHLALDLWVGEQIGPIP